MIRKPLVAGGPLIVSRGGTHVLDDALLDIFELDVVSGRIGEVPAALINFVVAVVGGVFWCSEIK